MVNGETFNLISTVANTFQSQIYLVHVGWQEPRFQIQLVGSAPPPPPPPPPSPTPLILQYCNEVYYVNSG